MGIFRLSLLTLASAVITQLSGQSLGNGSLSGKYNARHLMLGVNASGAITDARTFYGSLTFDGAGNFTYTGSQLVGSAAPLPISGAGKYAVQATGYISMTNFQRTDGAVVRGGLGQGAVVGSTQETPGVYDFLIAVPAAPSGSVTNGTINGTYWASTLEFPGGAAANVRNGSFQLKPNGAGSFGDISVSGKAANLQNKITTQTVAAASYSLTADGSGTANFPLASTSTALAQLLSGGRQIFVSADSSLVIGGSTSAGGHDLLIATRAFSGAANAASLRNLFFSAGMKLEPNRPGSYSGSANANGTGKLVSSRRVRQLEGVLDFTGGSSYALTADGSGSVETNRLALGTAGNSYIVNGLTTADSDNYEIGFGIRATAAANSAGTFYINPQGIVNAASFAPVGAPVSPGEFLSIFGAGFATTTTIAPGAPFPTTLGGVQVLVNNTPAPIYFVSAGQISCLVPFGVTGTTASFVVTTGGRSTNAVDLPLAKTSPGIFTVPSAGTGPGAILKPDFSLVSATNPAKRGDVVLVFLTGLGAVTPAVRDGALAPTNPLSLVPGTLTIYIGAKPAEILFQGMAPGLVGLYQLNLRVPLNSPTGTSVSFAIDSGDSFHDMVDIAVVP